MAQKILIIFLFITVLAFLVSNVHAQQFSVDEYVQYSGTSQFIKEFDVPVEEFGLRGITTDSSGNVWFYFSTQKNSTIFKFILDENKFERFDIGAKTQVADAIVNLAGGQLVYDEKRKTVWFTDARTNSIGNLHIEENKIELIPIPTLDSGPMGIKLSPNNEKVWFAELSSDTISVLDPESNNIREFKIKENTGPTFLDFDREGNLWVTLSYSNSILKIDKSDLESLEFDNILEISLPEHDSFSPFGIEIVDINGSEKIVLSDHGSSRIIVSELGSNLNSYKSYWTSESILSPQTLPSQVVSDDVGNIYFPQHIGNRISKLDMLSNKITEYDIPTGPLATVVYAAISNDGSTVWFTETFANKIGYLDTTASVPIDVKVQQDVVSIRDTKKDQIVLFVESNNSEMVSLENIIFSVEGMTHLGLRGLDFEFMPNELNLKEKSIGQTTLTLTPRDDIGSGKYEVMLRVSANEISNKNSTLSLLYPISLLVDISKPEQSFVNESDYMLSEITIKNIIQTIVLSVAIGLSALIVYKRIKSRRQNKIAI